MEGAEGIFYVIAAILLVAAIVGVVFRRLGQPVIVAYIAVGILLGPGLGILEPDIPEIALLAELGISLLLFIVGLELDVRLIKRVGPVALATGLGQVAFTSGVGFFIVLGLGYSVLHAVYVAVALTFSSTIIIVKLLSDKRETDQTHGRIAIGFLIVQDVVVVIALITLSALGGTGDAPGGPGRELVLTFARGAVFIAVIAALMRWVLPPLLDRIARHPETLILFAIAWAVGLAAVGSQLGFSQEVGAFVAGVSLASTRYRESIGSRLRSVRDFLLLFFFIDLGARMNIGQALDQLPAVLILSVFVLIGNPAIVMVIMTTIMRYPTKTSFLAGVTVAQISEFSLIFAALGAQIGHLDAAAVDLITLVGLITIGLSTYLIMHARAVYQRIEGPLRVFERRPPRRVDLEDEELRPEVVVFGIGRYGSAVIRDLVEAGWDVMGVDVDPRALSRCDGLQVGLAYGDADDPDFVEHLPLEHAAWVVSTLPDLQAAKALLQTLEGTRFSGRVAMTVNDPEVADELRAAGADHVFVPLVHAAHETVRVLGVDRPTGTIEDPDADR